RMRVMEGNRVGRWPEPRLRSDELIGSDRVLRVECLRHGQEIDRGLGPAFRETAVPERVVPYRLDLPHSVLVHVAVLVDPTLPPSALPALSRVMQARLHHRAPAHVCRAPIASDVDDHLHLRVIDEPPVTRAIV